ncbi:hypothetical protein ACHAO7_010139 [Fusarium culmorum]
MAAPNKDIVMTDATAQQQPVPAPANESQTDPVANTNAAKPAKPSKKPTDKANNYDYWAIDSLPENELPRNTKKWWLDQDLEPDPSTQPDENPPYKERKESYEKWSATGYPKAVHLAIVWPAATNNAGAMARYLHFRNNVAFITWIDCVCYYRTAATCSTENTTKNLPNPLDVLKAYTDKPTREWATSIITKLDRPTLIPVMSKTETGPDKQGSIDTVRFMLIHALQVLVFVPMARGDVDFTEGTYDRRFPSKLKGGNSIPAILDKYSMEDLNRAIVACYQLITRRNGSRDITTRIPGNQKTFPWFGYADLKFRINEAAPEGVGATIDNRGRAMIHFLNENRAYHDRIQSRVDQHAQLNNDEVVNGDDPTELPTELQPLPPSEALEVHESILTAFGSINLKKDIKKAHESSKEVELPHISAESEQAIIDETATIHKYVDHQKVFDNTTKQLFPMDMLISRDDLNTYIKCQEESPIIMEYAQKYPAELEGILQIIKNKFALDKTVSAIKPPTYNLDEICDHYAIPKHPNISLYPQDATIQKMMPHQLADAHTVVERMISPAPYIILANEMGTGKTKTFFAALKMRHLLLEAQLDELNKDPKFAQLSPDDRMKSGRFPGFRPHLCLGPVATIIQTVRESVENFPDFRNIVFYSVASSFPIKVGVEVVSKSRIHSKIQKYQSSEYLLNPNSGLTIFFSTYTTLSKRWMFKEEKPFRWVEGEGTPSTSKKTKRYNSKDINADQIVMLPENSRDEPHGILVTYYPSSLLIPDHHFDMLICDEAQYIRQVTGSYINLLQLFKWDRLLFVTGTPIASTLRDLLSPLTLIAYTNKHIRNFQYVTPSLGYLPGLYHDSYDPDADKTDITAEFGEKLGQTVGIFSEAFMAKHQENSEVTAALEFFKMAYDTWSLKPWMLSPNLLVDSSKELSWGVNLGSKVVKPLLKSFYIRRTMKTALNTPDGEVTYPSDGMLPSSIRIEECPYRPGNPDAELLRRIGQGYADSLFSSADAGLEQSTRAVPDPSEPADSNDLGLHDGTESHMNFGEHRAGVITAFDPRTIKLLQPTTPAFFGTKSKLIKEIAGLANAQGAQMTPSRKKHLKKLQSGSEIVGLGVEHIDKLLKESKNGGLHYVFHACCSESGMGPPLDRITFFRWLIEKSPTFIRAMQLMHHYIRLENTRVLLVVDTPWIQNYVVASLVLFGYNNDPTSSLEVFVANVQTMSTGVNLHKACHIGIFLNWHLNATVMEQTFARIDRLGQKHAVRWFLLKTPNTYHDNIERMVTAKWIVTTSTQSALPEWLEFELLEICLCEIHKSIWHAPFNRYAWIVEKELSGNDMNYHASHVVLLGHIFSMIAISLLTCPEDQQQFWKDNSDMIIRAAKRISLRKFSTCPLQSVDTAEAWLQEEAGKLRTRFFKVMTNVLNVLKTEPDSADAELKLKLGKLHLGATTRRTKATTVTLKEDESEDNLTEDEDDDEAGEDDAEITSANDSQHSNDETTARQPQPQPCPSVRQAQRRSRVTITVRPRGSASAAAGPSRAAGPSPLAGSSGVSEIAGTDDDFDPVATDDPKPESEPQPEPETGGHGRGRGKASAKAPAKSTASSKRKAPASPKTPPTTRKSRRQN